MEKLKTIFKDVNRLSLFVSVLALIFSFVSFAKSISVQEKNTLFNTYSMDLCYQIRFSEELKKENISFYHGGNNPFYNGEDIPFYNEDEIMLIISDTDFMSIAPKVGGINRVALILNQGKEDFLIIAFSDGENWTGFYEAQDAFITTENFLLNIYGEDEDKYYSSAFILIEDYKHNFYLDMLIFEISKDDLSDIEKYVYNKFDLLNTYNKENYLDWFTNEQMKKYLKLRDRLNEIL